MPVWIPVDILSYAIIGASLLLLLLILWNRLYYSPRNIVRRAEQCVARQHGVSYAFVHEVIKLDTRHRLGMITDQQLQEQTMRLAWRYPKDSGLTQLLQEEEFRS